MLARRLKEAGSTFSFADTPEEIKAQEEALTMLGKVYQGQ